MAVLLTAYVILVERPARRRRLLHADDAIAIQIDLLRRAAQEEHRREGAEAGRAARLRGKAETDEPARAVLWAYWVVSFADPKTGNSYRVETSFSEPSVTDYLTKHP